MGNDELLAVFKATPTPALILSADTGEYKVLEVNDALLQYFSLQREQVTGGSLPDFLFPVKGEPWNREDLFRSLEQLKMEKTGQQMRVAGYQVPAGEGTSIRFFASRNIPVLNHNEEVAFILHTLEEVIPSVQSAGSQESQAEALDYTSLFYQNPDTVFSMDPVGNFISVNQAAAELTGYSREELMTMHFTHLTDPSETEKLEKLLQECLQGQPASFETVGYHASGQVLELAVTVMPVVKNGGIQGIFGIVKDITEIRKLEREKNLISSISTTFSQEDCLSVCLEKTLHQLCTFTGIDAGELWLSSIDGEEMTLANSYFSSGHPDNEPQTTLKEFEGLVGEAWKRAEVVSMPDLRTDIDNKAPRFVGDSSAGMSFPIVSNGAVIAVFAFYSSNRKKIDNLHLSQNLLNQLATHIQRKKAEQELNQYFMMSPDMIGFLDPSGYFKKVNLAFKRVLGFREEELLTAPFTNFIHPDDREKSAAELRCILDQQPTTGFENRYITRDGQVRWISWTSTVLPQDRMVLTVGRDVTKRKYLEQTVKLQQRRFESLYKEAPVSMCIMKGKDHVFESANSAYYELTSRTPEIIGKTVREVFPELKEDGYFEWLDKVYESGKTVSYSEVLLRVLNANGEVKENYISFIYQPYYNHSGEIEGTFYFGVDVTREVLARKKIEESERQYIGLIQNLPAAVYTTDREGRIRLYNKAAAELFGCEADTGNIEWSEAVGLFAPDGSRMSFAESPMVRTLISGPAGTAGIEILIRTADGKIRNVIVNTLQTLNSEKEVTGSINVIIDITERKRSEEQLRKLSLVGMKTNNFVLITNAAGTIDWVNDAFCDFIDLPKEKILGERPSVLLYGSHPYYGDIPPNSAVPIMENLHLMDQTYELEMEYRSRDNRIFWVELKGQPLRDATGQITHYFIIGLDISEKKRSYDKLKKSKNEIKSFARQLNNVLEEERARIAREFHDEFGQQLTGLKMSLSTLKRRQAGERLTAEIIDPMLQDVDVIIQHIRNFATDLRPAILDTLGLLPSIEWLVREFEKKTGITTELVLDVKEDLKLDRNLSICCFRICQEALTNVARHSQATKVKVKIVQGDELSLKIIDNGKGMHKAKITDPLSMGLLGMRERANLVGGELYIASTPGSVTSVHFMVRLFPSINIL